MPLYLLRHEEREYNTSFDTSLTEEGKCRAEQLIPRMVCRLGIETIYCSPFLRTLQTIAPYCRSHQRTVNVDWSLAEEHPTQAYCWSEFDSIINRKYRSLAPHNPDLDDMTFDELKKQVYRFLKTLNSQQNILLVTHMPVINAVLSLRGFPVDMYTPHEAGGIVNPSTFCL